MAEGGSKKGKTMSLNEFLGDSGSSSGGSWADRTDDHEPRGGSSYGDRGGDRGGYGGDRGGRGGYGDRGGGDRYGGGGDRYGGGGDRYGGGGDRYGGGGRGGGGGGYGGDRGGYGGGAREDRYGGAERGPSRDPPDNPPFIAFVGNLSFDLQEDELFDFFTSGGCKVKTARMISDQFTGRSKGFGYIEFEDKESLVVALDADREELNGRSLRVDVAEERQSAEFGESRADKVDRWERGRAVAREERDSGRDRPMRGGDRGDDRGGRYGDRGGDRGADGPRGRPRVALTKAVAAPKKKSNPFGDATPIKSKADMLVEEQAKKAAAAKAKKDAEEAKKAAEAPAEAPADDAAPADAAPADDAAAPAADAAAEVAEVAEKVADVKVEE